MESKKKWVEPKLNQEEISQTEGGTLVTGFENTKSHT
jgi:hypothetical protein